MDRYHWLLDHLHDPVSLWAEGFRNTTGLSKEEFLALLDETRASGEFVDEEARGIGRPDPIPLEYKLLMALVKMRQGVSFYSFEASMEISRTVAGNFFHKFCAWLSSPAKYGEQVFMPRTPEERDRIEIVYRNLGHFGCVGSKDGVHFPSHRIADDVRWLAENRRYQGRQFCANVTVSHNGLAQYTTPLFYGNTPDSAMLRHDEHDMRLNDRDDIFFNTPINLKDVLGNPVTEQGNWVLCDNGYERSQGMLCPSKDAMRDAGRPIGFYSGMIESTRKDIECFFGHIKREFQQFRNGVEFKDVMKVQNMWRAALYLHNRKIRENGFDSHGDEVNDYVCPIQRLRRHVIDGHVLESIDVERRHLLPGQALIVHQLQPNSTDAQRRYRFEQKRMHLAHNFWRLDYEFDAIYNLRTRADLFKPVRN